MAAFRIRNHLGILTFLVFLLHGVAAQETQDSVPKTKTSGTKTSRTKSSDSKNNGSVDSNRLTYLDEFCDPYYPNLQLAKLTTPQWVGEEGVDAVITLGIDDMREPGGYEAYLRPILDRLKKIDGRAAVSIMTCTIDPKHKQLQSWLDEGVSIECHTIDHPCPCLQGGNFDRAKDTYDRCVDLMHKIPGNSPVAFRFPCMDSLNTPSPRAFAEIVNRKTPDGNFLQISTSVTCLLTPKDKSIRHHFERGHHLDESKFRKYIPFPSFVNKIENYPYPYLIGHQCWEFPCTIPDDWQGQNLHRPNNPKTVEDLKAAVDATITKKGVANIIFHPHAWIRAEQMVELIDHVDKTYGKRVKFLTFKECQELINQHLLKNVPVRDQATGENSGVRLLDLNGDGFQDVLIGNKITKIGRIWNPTKKTWAEFQHSLNVNQTRFGIHDGQVIAVTSRGPGKLELLAFSSQKNEFKDIGKFPTDRNASIDRLRIRDLNRDGKAELIFTDHGRGSTLNIDFARELKIEQVATFPFSAIDSEGRDNGLRFVDLNEDAFGDLLISNDTQSAVALYNPDSRTFKTVKPGTEIPRVVSAGRNNGTWFANGHLWVQNEHTHRLPDGVDRRSFHQILANAEPAPKSPEASLDCIEVGDGFKVELMAAEPLVMDPIAIEWGLDGKLWVVEMADYPLGMDDRGKPGGRVRYLEDTNGDGKYDKSTLFVDEIPFPTGVLPTNIDPDKPSCLISAAPFIVRANQKTNWKQLVGDEKNILLQGFGEGNQQHRFNGFPPGLDNWIYLANGDSGGVIQNEQGKRLNIRGLDLRIKIGDTTQFEAQTGQTQFGRHCDQWGYWFGCSNPIPLRQYVLPDHYLKRNPNYRYPAARIDIATAGNTQVYPRSRVLSHWSGYRPPAPGQPHRFTSACSTDFYQDHLLGADYENNSFTCEPVHNLVHRRIVKRNGIRFTSSRAPNENDREFLASSDSWFRPTTVKTGPDGALWITDMYRLVIEHPEWIDDQREKELFLRTGHDRGRIYRVVPRHKRPEPLPQRPVVKITNEKGVYTKEFTTRLLVMLQSRNRWQAETAQRFLIHVGDRCEDENLENSLVAILESAFHLVRIRALCTLDGRNEVDTDDIQQALIYRDPEVSRHAIRIAERFLAQGDQDELLEELGKFASDPDPAVRMQLAFSLGYSRQPAAAKILAKIAAENHDEPYIIAAVVSSLNKDNLAHVVRESEKIDGSSEFLVTLLEQSIRFGLPGISRSSLDRILASKDPSKIPTRQLELVIQIFQGVPDLKNSGIVDLEKRADTFRQSVFDSLSNNASPRRKAAAVRLFSRSPLLSVKDKIEWLTQRIGPRVDLQIQKLAVDELARINQPDVSKFLVDKWRTVTPDIQQAFLAAILQRPAWSIDLLQSIAKEKNKVEDFSTNQRNLLLTHSNTDAAEKAKSLFNQAPPSNKELVVQKYLTAIGKAKRKPDMASGQTVFKKHCSSCHRLNEVGQSVGPNLVSIKDASLPALMHAVIQPNRAVEDKYRTYVIALDDGRELTGMIQSESSTQIQLANNEGKSIQLLRSEIERIKGTGRSLMPQDLEKEIDFVAMQDLVHFLQTSISRAAPLGKRKQFPGNQPKVVLPNEKGNLKLAAIHSEIYGPQVVFESKYQNLGFWGHVDDIARWQFQSDRKGKYDVYLNYACPGDTAGNQFELNVEGNVVRGKVSSTKSWDSYSRKKIGSVDLKPGRNTARFSAAGPLKGFLLDLKSIELVPVK